MKGSYLTSSPSSSMDRQIVHFSSVSDSSPSSCSALPSCGLLCSKVKDINLVRPRLSNALPSLGSCRKINDKISIYQPDPPAQGSQPSQNSQRDECATNMLLVGISPPGASGSEADGSGPRSSLSSAAPIQPPTTSLQWEWPHGLLCRRLLLGQTSKLMGPPLPGRTTTVPRASLATGPAPCCTTGQCSACQLPLFLSQHIHSYSYNFPGLTGDAARDKCSRSYLTSNLGNATSLPSSRERPTHKITTRTSILPNFSLARPKNLPPISSWAGGQLQGRRHPLSSEGRTRSPRPRSRRPHGGRGAAPLACRTGRVCMHEGPLVVCTFLPGADRGEIAPAGWEKVETLLKIWPAAS